MNWLGRLIQSCIGKNDTIYKKILNMDIADINIKNFIHFLREKKQSKIRMKYREVLNQDERILGCEINNNTRCHKARYKFASKYIDDNDAVIDYACGTGYGSKILARSNKKAKIIAYDVSEKAIQYGKRHWRAKNIEFTTKKPEDPANIIIAFEFLEHTNNIKEVYLYLYNLTKNIFIFSVPYNERPGNNPHHKHFHLTANDFHLPKGAFVFYQNKIGEIHSELPENERQNMVIVIKK